MEDIKQLDIVQSYIRIHDTIEDILTDCRDFNCEEDTLAAGLHDYCNQVRIKDGKLKPEDAKPIDGQNPDTQQKYIYAALDVTIYWHNQLRRCDDILNIPYSHSLAHTIKEQNELDQKAREGLISEMMRAVDYLSVADKQTDKTVPARPGEFHTEYSGFIPKEKDQDQLILAVITDMILDRADIGYQRKINR